MDNRERIALGGRPVGALLLFRSTEKDTFTPVLLELLARLAENVSFAVGNFERAKEKVEAEKRIEYLATLDSLKGLPNRESFNQLLQRRPSRLRGLCCRRDSAPVRLSRCHKISSGRSATRQGTVGQSLAALACKWVHSAPRYPAYIRSFSIRDSAERATICPNIARRMLPWCFRGTEKPKLLSS
jgi:hypothetical protein